MPAPQERCLSSGAVVGRRVGQDHVADPERTQPLQVRAARRFQIEAVYDDLYLLLYLSADCQHPGLSASQCECHRSSSDKRSRTIADRRFVLSNLFGGSGLICFYLDGTRRAAAHLS